MHTSHRTIQEIANQSKMNPKHIVFASWVLTPDAGACDIIETAYLRTHGTAWNFDKIDNQLPLVREKAMQLKSLLIQKGYWVES